jgi:hypothetical protein
VNGASPTSRDATTEFSADQTQMVAQNPEQRRIGSRIGLEGFAIDFERESCHELVLFKFFKSKKEQPKGKTNVWNEGFFELINWIFRPK